MVTKIADSRLLHYAIQSAIADRESFAQACGAGEVADAALALVGRLHKLQGRRFAYLSGPHLDDARLCFIYAEQWELSRVDAGIEHGTTWESDPARRATSFKAFRLKRWGRTTFERDVQSAHPVSMRDLLAACSKLT